MDTNVSQALFEMTAVNGTEFSFVVLEGEQCAIVRDGEIAETFLADDAGLGRALRRYFAMIEGCGGARHPFEAMDVGHPHAG